MRKFIGTTNWGKNLNGASVNTQVDFTKSINDLRTLNGRNVNYPWSNPVKWNAIFAYMNSSSGYYGSDDDALRQLTSINISVLVVQSIGCSGTNLALQSMDATLPVYWAERWELYKHSYALAIWAYNKGVKKFEFYNEPDLDLDGVCLDASKFKDLYSIRSLSIQNAYADLNSVNLANKIK